MDKLQRLSMEQSLRIPGIPGIPPKRVPSWTRPMYIGPMNYLPTPQKSKFVPVDSINYDYNFSNLDSPKVLWLQLRFPAPKDLRVGSTVLIRIQAHPPRINESLQNQKFSVEDIAGTKVILTPYRGNNWLPTTHSDALQGWGYNTDIRDPIPALHSWNYGHGKPAMFLEYYPY